MNNKSIETAFDLAKKRFEDIGVNVETAIENAEKFSVALNCWQGDDIKGFEKNQQVLQAGIQVTGNYPGKANNGSELRADLIEAMRLIPGKTGVSLHAMYLEFANFVERDRININHFKHWLDWAKEHEVPIDFNPTLFAHHKYTDALTLSHSSPKVRNFWINHCQQSRQITQELGKQLGVTSTMNLWIPDGMKDKTIDMLKPRLRLMESLDKVFSEKMNPSYHNDYLESKLFGIGLESYTVGSHEFYLGYASSRDIGLTLDCGHFHPTESIAQKISAIIPFIPKLLLHMSRPVRWDSDHTIIFEDEIQLIAHEIVRNFSKMKQIHIGLDFFDASINRIAGWVISARNVKKALLRAFLEPTELLIHLEQQNNFTERLAIFEEQKSLPWQAIWDFWCLRQNVPVGSDWINCVKVYENHFLSQRKNA